MNKRRVRRYTDRDKAAALAHLQSGPGIVDQAARELGIPNETLRGWAEGQHLGPKVAQEFGVVRDSLSAKLEDAANKMVDAMPGKIEGASLKDLSATLAQVIDKMRLLREEPTAITESINRRAMLERLIERTMEEFPGKTREEVIEAIRDVKPEAIKFLT